jgi:hypothetical protein
MADPTITEDMEGTEILVQGHHLKALRNRQCGAFRQAITASDGGKRPCLPAVAMGAVDGPTARSLHVPTPDFLIGHFTFRHHIEDVHANPFFLNPLQGPEWGCPSPVGKNESLGFGGLQQGGGSIADRGVQRKDGKVVNLSHKAKEQECGQEDRPRPPDRW